MKQQDAKPEQALPHDLILEGRNRLTATGVRRVLRCDAEGAALLTSKGTLELTGAELSITSLDLDKGEVKLAGRVDTLEIPQSTRRAVSAPPRPMMGPASRPGRWRRRWRPARCWAVCWARRGPFCPPGAGQRSCRICFLWEPC
ncbi:MAG: YabP/YqfC family sporulation protein [Faecalibacterium prausnitzii]